MTKDDLNILIVPALRDALSSHTFDAELICRVIIRNAKDIRSDIKLAMIKKIERFLTVENQKEYFTKMIWDSVLDSLEQ